MKKVNLAYIFLLIFCLSCTNKLEKKELKSFLGSKIVLPENLIPFNFPEGYSSSQDLLNTRKIILYIDSSSCSECKIKELHRYNDVINYLRSESDDFSFIIIFGTDNNYFIKNTMDLFNVKLPYFLDIEQNLKTRNEKFPSSVFLHCFLIINNKVVLSGEPIHNDKMLLLYRRELSK